uniref:Ubiquitin-like domain-containing protein n=1 Tax=Elaeophora elaphi TaxID=1147741 RepID=A0A0R3RT34_9BILA
MAGFIEGIGDEVIWFLIALVVVVLISLAWISTGIPPVDYYVWLVQMQIHPNRRIVQVLQVDNQEVNLFRGRPEGRPFGAVTEQTLEALMDSGVMEQSNTSRELVLPQAAEIARRQTSEDTSLHAQEVSQAEQATSSVENEENLLHASYIETETDNWQQSSDLLASTSAEDGRNSLTDAKHELCSVVTGKFLNNSAIYGTNFELNWVFKWVCAKSKISDSTYQSAAGVEEDNDGHQLSNVKLKFLDDSQVIACTALESTVGQFKRRYFWESILAGKIVRLIYRGQLLRDDTRSLLSYGLHDQCVVHCHVSSTPYAQPSSSAPNASNNSVLSHESSDVNSGTAAAAIAAIAGSQSVSADSTDGLTRTIIQTFRGHSIEDNQNDPILIRVQNAFLRTFRYGYNVIMGPDPGVTAVRVTSLDAAADAAAGNGWNQNENAVGGRIGQYVQVIFIVKFLVLWTFVFLYPQYTDRFSLLLLTFLSMFFVSILFSNAHRANSNGVQTQI